MPLAFWTAAAVTPLFTESGICAALRCGEVKIAKRNQIYRSLDGRVSASLAASAGLLPIVADLLPQMLPFKLLPFNDVTDVTGFSTSYTNYATHHGSPLRDEGGPAHRSLGEGGSTSVKLGQARSRPVKVNITILFYFRRHLEACRAVNPSAGRMRTLLRFRKATERSPSGGSGPIQETSDSQPATCNHLFRSATVAYGRPTRGGRHP